MAEYAIGHNRYAVDESGDVYLLDGKGIKKFSVDRDGYKMYTFHMGAGRMTTRRAHRVVWEAHNGPIPEGMTVDHINGKRGDNRLVNLRLMLPADNVREGRSSPFSFKSPDGVVHKGKNIKEFCKANGLSHTGMCRLMCGEFNQSKGWTRHEI